MRCSQVGNRIRDLEKWKDQIRRYLTFFSKNENIIKSKLKCTKISQVYGMLLFRWGMPIPVVTETDIVYADWSTLSNILKVIEKPKISEINKFFRIPRDINQIPRQWKIEREYIQVAQWTYIRPIIVSD